MSNSNNVKDSIYKCPMINNINPLKCCAKNCSKCCKNCKKTFGTWTKNYTPKSSCFNNNFNFYSPQMLYYVSPKCNVVVLIIFEWNLRTHQRGLHFSSSFMVQAQINLLVCYQPHVQLSCCSWWHKQA